MILHLEIRSEQVNSSNPETNYACLHRRMTCSLIEMPPHFPGSVAPLLKVTGLRKTLGGKLVVDGVDLSCRAGEVIGLLGPNEAGKTTSLRMCYGFLRPDASTIRIAGHDLGTDVETWLTARGTTPATVLADWHFALDAAGLASFVAAFPQLRYDVRPPNLDDLFLSMNQQAKS